jgi:hypothetical protein
MINQLIKDAKTACTESACELNFKFCEATPFPLGRMGRGGHELY